MEIKNKEIRTKIATFLGWQDIFVNGPISPADMERCPPILSLIGTRYDGILLKVPDYPNDLNAMHEAEMALDDTQYEAYWDNLVYICTREGYERMNSTTAKMRAEAFILTIKEI